MFHYLHIITVLKSLLMNKYNQTRQDSFTSNEINVLKKYHSCINLLTARRSRAKCKLITGEKAWLPSQLQRPTYKKMVDGGTILEAFIRNEDVINLPFLQVGRSTW